MENRFVKCINDSGLNYNVQGGTVSDLIEGNEYEVLDVKNGKYRIIGELGLTLWASQDRFEWID